MEKRANGKKPEIPNTNKEAFDKMLRDLYHESKAMRHPREPSEKILKMKFPPAE